MVSTLGVVILGLAGELLDLSLSTVFSFRSLLQVFYEVAEDECVSEGSRGVFGDPWRRGRELPGVA